MTTPKVELLKVLFGAVMLVVGWWVVFRSDRMRHLLGNPVSSRTPRMASISNLYNKFIGIALMVVGVILVVKGVI